MVERPTRSILSATSLLPIATISSICLYLLHSMALLPLGNFSIALPIPHLRRDQLCRGIPYLLSIPHTFFYLVASLDPTLPPFLSMQLTLHLYSMFSTD